MTDPSGNTSGASDVISRVPSMCFPRSFTVRRSLLLPALAAALSAQAVVLDPPSLRCASVDVAGDVTLTWVPPADPNGDFASYEVWHSALPGGPFAQLTTIGVYGQTSWTHGGANANSGPQYYYLTTVSSAPPPNTSLPGDTLATIHLQLSQSNPLGSALLDWTALHQPPLGTSGSSYEVWLEYPIGTWMVLDQTVLSQLDYEHVISICEDSLTYRIGLTDAEGCTSFSNVAGDVFADATPPSPPVLEAVTVDSLTGLSTISWAPSPEGDTDAYIIVLVTSGGNVILDTIYGQNNTTYVWAGSQAGMGAESFTVAAFDTCWTGNPPSPNTSATLSPHTTLHATTAYDRCAGEITVIWSGYVGWDVDFQELWVQENGGTWALLSTLPAGASSAQHTGVDPFSTYCYIVKAVRDGGAEHSLSNRTCRITDYPPVPQFNYLRTVTVPGTNEIAIIDSVDTGAQVRRYRLQRSFNGGPWQPLVNVPGGGGPLIQFTDTDVLTAERSYQYRVVVDDSCGNEVLTSNLGNSILLRAEAGLDGINRLNWNGYAGWAGNVGGYEVHRSIDDGPFQLLQVNAPLDWSFEDDVSGLDQTGGRFCYFVLAREAGNPSGIDAESMSNPACAIQEAQLWVPNAFIAGGVNDRFIPVTAFTDFAAYEFTIFNRWGQEIWTTGDPDMPWKGQVNGSYVPQGVYAWYCAIRDGAGRTYERRGTVTFLWGQE